MSRRCFPIAISLAVALMVRPARSQDISDSALRQIKELLDEKISRTPAQQKLGSQLVYAIKTANGQAITPSVPSLTGSGVNIDALNDALVDIKGIVSSDLLAAIAQAGGRSPLLLHLMEQSARVFLYSPWRRSPAAPMSAGSNRPRGPKCSEWRRSRPEPDATPRSIS
jgi:hypothetical protein